MNTSLSPKGRRKKLKFSEISAFENLRKERWLDLQHGSPLTNVKPASASMLAGYAERRNIVFHEQAGPVGCYEHEKFNDRRQ